MLGARTIVEDLNNVGYDEHMASANGQPQKQGSGSMMVGFGKRG